MLVNVLEKTFRKINKPVVVGVSGGPDSMALLHAMMELNLSPVAAYFNHRLREEADQEADFVRNVADSLGVLFREESGDARLFSNEGGLSIEEAARILRYQFLFQAAVDLRAGAVAVAHHADDQVETILMNLLRGTGMKGMLGMREVSLPNQWSESIPLVRPFLGVWKEQILEYLNENHISFLKDPSNAELIFHRNKIRHQLVPLLENTTPGFRSRLLQTANILYADDIALEKLSENAWDSCLNSQGTGYVQFAREIFLKYPLAIKRRLIRKALKNLRPDFRDLGFQHAERALDFLQDPKRKSTNWVAKVNLSQSPKRIVFSTWETDLVKDQFPQLPNRKEVPCPLEGEIKLGNGWYFTIQPMSYSLKHFNKNDFPNDDFMVWIDSDSVSESLFIRSRREGDLFSPLGMAGKSMKVSDLMINEKIPAAFRALWPLVVMGDTILWVPGGRLGHAARITEDTKSLLKLAFIKRES
jgi:tRNA(Ile)-lysidine synthase